MQHLIIVFISIFIFIKSSAQSYEAYQIYTSKGKKTSFKKVINQAKKNDVIFFGELHNNPISHWLQLQLLKSLSKDFSVIAGAEMFEADNQDAINNYLQGKISLDSLKQIVRLWPNFTTDYLPLLRFAKDHKIPFIATNVPRKYASMVYKGGFNVLDSLPEEEKRWIAPLPIPYDENLPTYQKMKTMMPGHGGENLPKAQAVKDATMAHFINKNIKPNHKFIHFNGSYHSDEKEGIVWYLKKLNPELHILTITTVLQSDTRKLEDDNKNKADYIIVVPEDMTTTY